MQHRARNTRAGSTGSTAPGSSAAGLYTKFLRGRGRDAPQEVPSEELHAGMQLLVPSQSFTMNCCVEVQLEHCVAPGGAKNPAGHFWQTHLYPYQLPYQPQLQ